MLLRIEFAQLLEARHARALRDAGVSSAQQHDAIAILDRFEHAPRFEVAFRPEIFADFAALVHGRSLREVLESGQVSDGEFLTMISPASGWHIRGTVARLHRGEVGSLPN